MHHVPNVWAVIFLGAGLRCGWAVMAFWAAVSYAVIVSGLCLFFKGCSVREGEEAIKLCEPLSQKEAEEAGIAFTEKEADALNKALVKRNQHRTSPGEFLVGKGRKYTAASSATSDPCSSGTTARKRSSKTARCSQWRQNKHQPAKP